MMQKFTLKIKMGTSCVGRANFMHESQIKAHTTITKQAENRHQIERGGQRAQGQGHEEEEEKEEEEEEDVGCNRTGN